MQWFTKILFSLLFKATMWLFKVRYGEMPANNDVERWRLYIQKIANGNDVAAIVLLTKTKIDDALLLALKSVCSVPALFQTAWSLAFQKQEETKQEETKLTLIQRLFKRFSVGETGISEPASRDVQSVATLLQALIPENCEGL